MTYEYIVIYSETQVRRFSDLESAKELAEAVVNRGHDVEIYAKEIETGKFFLVDKRSGNHE